jgi:YARHG domain
MALIGCATRNSKHWAKFKELGARMRFLGSWLIVGLAATAALAMVPVAPAHADDDFADWSCQALYLKRNGIYKQRGYCFKTAKAIKAFGNAGCSYDDIDDVPLSPDQHKAVARMRSTERAKGC